MNTVDASRSSVVRLSCCLVLLAAGCGGTSHRASPGAEAPDAGLDAGVDAGPVAERCTRVPALLEARSACRQDDQCPCGAHCALGVCVHECLQDSDCAGWCDLAGRCREASDRSSVPEVRLVDKASFRVHPVEALIYAPGNEVTVSIAAEARSMGRVRLEASPGLLIRCGDEDRSECELDGPTAAAATRIKLTVGAADAGVAATSWRLRVFHGQEMKTVSLELSPPAPAGPMRSGVYRGTIWAESSRATLLGNEPSLAQRYEDDAPLLALPLEARVFADGTLVLVDARGVFPSPWKFQVGADGTFAGATAGADASRRVFLATSGPVDETATEVSVDASGSLRMTSDQTLVGRLETVLAGMGLSYQPTDSVDERPVVGWGFSLTRAGDLPPSDLPGNYVTADAQPTFAPDADRYGQRLPWDAVLAGVTLTDPDSVNPFPSWLERMEYWLCYRRDASAASAGSSRPFGADVKTPLADYACEESAPAPGTMIRAFPFFSLDADATAGSLLQSCLTDLAKVGEPPPAADGCAANAINCLTGDAAPRGCLDAPLVLRALGLGLEQFERHGWPARPYYVSRSDAPLRLAHRLLQQWLQLATFVTREATQQSDLAFGPQPPDPAPALARSLDGWNVLLHPKVAGRLMHFPVELLRDTDYRSGQTAVSLDQCQAIGLPVLMLETLAAQAEAAAQLASQTRFTVRAQLPPQVARTLRAVVAVTPLARALHGRASAGATTPPSWESFWQDAEHHLADAVARLQVEWIALEKGANPLGIEEADLPLFHSGADADDAIDRFKATSNYLLALGGGGGAEPGWATRAVDKAVASSQAAQVQWERLLERRLQASLAQQARDDRLAQIAQNYGEKLLSLCGEKMFPVSSADTVLDSLGQHPEITAYSCFLDQQDPACRFDEDELLAKLTSEDMAFRMCVLGGLQQQFAAKVQFENDAANEFVKQAAEVVGPYNQGQAMAEQIGATLKDLGDIVVAAWKQEKWKVSDIATDEKLTVRTEDPNDLTHAETMCRTLFPSAVPMNKRMAELESSPLDRPQCYHGSMGELALTVRAAAKDIDVATARFQELTDKYTIALRSCLMQESALSQKQEVLEAAAKVTEKVERLQAVSDGIFGVAGGALGCVCGSGVDTLTGCANSILSVPKDALQGVFNQLLTTAPVVALSNDFLSSIQDQVTNALCFNDAQMSLVGADTQARQIEKTRLDLALAMLKLRNAQDAMTRLVAEGTGRIAAERQRAVTSLVNETWKDLWDLDLATAKDAVEKARGDLMVARRAAYLAVRAVEYEWQMSLTARTEVLRATRASDLQAVLDGLRTTLAPNAIAGQTPKNANVVLSLREHVLQLADMKGWPAGQPTWTDGERLRQLLTSPQLAAYDDGGNYLGQLLPFEIAPLGVLGLGNPGGLPVLTGADCAERLWKVNLVLQGEQLVDGGETKTRVDVLQRNVFYSQRCLPREAESSLQSLSVRPSRNLFQDPIWGQVDGTSGSSGETDKFLRAAVDAYHNISRGEFEKAAYEQGASMELACRGLYGEYALFFPKDLLAIDGRTGLHLEHVDDVLIRFDYVSVSKSW